MQRGSSLMLMCLCAYVPCLGVCVCLCVGGGCDCEHPLLHRMVLSPQPHSTVAELRVFKCWVCRVIPAPTPVQNAATHTTSVLQHQKQGRRAHGISVPLPPLLTYTQHAQAHVHTRCTHT